MKNIKKSNKKNIASKIYIFAYLFFLICFATYVNHYYKILNDYNKQINQLSNEIELEKKNNAKLIEQIEYKNSNEYIEKIAREKLGMIKNNEIIFIDVNK